MAAVGTLIYDSVSEEIISTTEKFAMTEGARSVTVRKILNNMGVTNRVFYNRFRNIDEVLEIIYMRTIERMKESLKSDFDPKTDFFNYIADVSIKVLMKTYDLKNQFCQYMFEFDSYSERNRIWWMNKIKEIIDIAKSTKQLKEIDSEMLSYNIWCYFRGYNADAVNRKLSKEEAVRRLKFGLTCLLDGVRNQTHSCTMCASES